MDNTRSPVDLCGPNGGIVSRSQTIATVENAWTQLIEGLTLGHRLATQVKEEVSLKTILLVDDSKFMRKANEKGLTKAGYSVISVGDGEEALRLASARVPDLILLDMLLPKLGGQDVLAALKRNPETAVIPVIVLSSLAQTNEAKLKKEGAAAYFEKSKLGLEQGCEALIRIVENILGPAVDSQEHCDSPEDAKIPSLI
jgi:CheY-like chemotaxis protein